MVRRRFLRLGLVRSALVIAGGDPERTLTALSRLPARPDVVIGVDSGVEVAVESGIAIDVAVGDFDSLAPSLVERLDTLASEVVRHPHDKDASDLELALAWCRERLPAGSGVMVAGIEGDRPDHHLAAVLLAAAPGLAALSVSVLGSEGQTWVVHAGAAAETGGLPAGSTASVIPVHGDAEVSLAGVRWPLDHHVLTAGTTLGVSNVVTDPPATVVCHRGTVLLVVPDRV